MKQYRSCLATALCLAANLASAEGTATLYQDGRKAIFSNAVALHTSDPFDKSQQITTLLFADRSISLPKTVTRGDRATAVENELREQGGSYIELNLKADGTMLNINVNTPSSSSSSGGNGWYTLNLTRSEPTHVEGTFKSDDDADKKKGTYYDLKFSLNIADAD